MSIILMLLKIIGIVLLAVLGILILLLLLVLFVPAHYSIDGMAGERNAIQGKVHWLFHILTVSFGYEGGEMDYSLRIFGIKKRLAREKPIVDEDEWEDDTEISEENAIPPKEEDGQKKDRWEKKLPKTQTSKSKRVRSHRKESLYQKLKKRIQECGHRIKHAINKVLYTITHIREKIEDIKNIITDETNKKSVLGILKEVRYLFTHFRFRKIDAELTFSAGEPQTTGQALGILCLIPAMYLYQVQVYPDFDTEEIYVKGRFSIKGHARMLHILISFARLFTDKEFRKFVKQIMK